MNAFGYSYLEERFGVEKTKALKLPNFKGDWTDGDVYAYEALNFVDGKRSVQQIRDLLSAAYGPVPLEQVIEYFHALESIGVVKRVDQ